jgi:hypothetical protein
VIRVRLDQLGDTPTRPEVLATLRRVSKQLSLLLKPYEVEARASAPAMVSS